MNYSIYESYSDYDDFEYDPSSSLWQVCIVVMEIMFIIIGIFGNALLIVIIFANKSMHDSAPNYLLVCLGIGDLLLLTLGGPIFVLKKLTMYAAFIHETTFGCKLVHGCLVMAECVSVGTFTALSVDRYMVIRYRMTSYSNTQSYRKYIGICIFIWILACLISAPIFHQAHVKTWEVYNVTIITCFPFVMSSSFGKSYEVMFLICIYILPLILILICYSKMAFILMTSIRTNNVISKGSATDAMMRRRYLARSVLIMILIFAVCWLPMHATEIVRQFDGENIALLEKVKNITDLKYLVVIFSACANPLVLFTVSKQFQKHLKRYFCCKTIDEKPGPKSFTLVQSYRKLQQEREITRSSTL